MRLYFRLLIILFFSTFAFAQDDSTHTVSGKFTNARGEMLFSDTFEFNPKDGTYLRVPEQEDAKKNLRVIPFDEGSDGSFLLKDISIDKDFLSGCYTIIDQKNGLGTIKVVSTAQVSDGKIEMGDIELTKLHKVQGRYTYPDFVEPHAQYGLVINVALRLGATGMCPIAYTAVEKDGKFQIQLPSGKYLFFLEVKDVENNWRRLNVPIEVKNEDIVFDKPFKIEPTVLDVLTAKETTLHQIYRKFSPNHIDVVDQKALSKLTKNADNRITVIYFFAGYCPPCFGDNGIRKYMDLAMKHKNLNVIAVHTDSYNSGSCPKSPEQMNDLLNGKNEKSAHWVKLNQKYLEAKAVNPNVFVMWQQPEIAKKLGLNAYPTVIVFENGVLRKPFTSVDTNVEDYIKSLL